MRNYAVFYVVRAWMCCSGTCIVWVPCKVDPCALARTQKNLYEKFSLCSGMGELFPPVPRNFLPLSVLVAILFSRISGSKMLWHRSLLVLLFNLLFLAVCCCADFVHEYLLS